MTNRERRGSNRWEELNRVTQKTVFVTDTFALSVKILTNNLMIVPDANTAQYCEALQDPLPP